MAMLKVSGWVIMDQNWNIIKSGFSCPEAAYDWQQMYQGADDNWFIVKITRG